MWQSETSHRGSWFGGSQPSVCAPDGMLQFQGGWKAVALLKAAVSLFPPFPAPARGAGGGQGHVRVKTEPGQKVRVEQLWAEAGRCFWG